MKLVLSFCFGFIFLFTNQFASAQRNGNLQLSFGTHSFTGVEGDFTIDAQFLLSDKNKHYKNWIFGIGLKQMPRLDFYPNNKSWRLSRLNSYEENDEDILTLLFIRSVFSEYDFTVGRQFSIPLGNFSILSGYEMQLGVRNQTIYEHYYEHHNHNFDEILNEKKSSYTINSFKTGLSSPIGLSFQFNQSASFFMLWKPTLNYFNEFEDLVDGHDPVSLTPRYSNSPILVLRPDHLVAGLQINLFRKITAESVGLGVVQ